MLPIANFTEEEGTFTNLRGRVQRFLQAKAAPGFARPSWFVLADLLAALGDAGRTTSLASDVFEALAGAQSEFARTVVRHARPARPHDRRRRQTAGARRVIRARAASGGHADLAGRERPECPAAARQRWCWFVATVVKMLVVFTIYMVGVMLVIWAERKISAWIQDRRGPNRVGPFGLLQSVADGVKNIMKEETYPGQAYLPLFVLAPVMSFVPALLTWAVIPFGAPWDSPWGTIDMVIAPLPIGFLFILAISSLGVYGIVLAGWSSNNKYALLGGLRSSAQMISYEISMGMSTIPVLILAGNVSLNQIVQQQAGGGLHWNVLNLTMAFFVFIVAAFAETNRAAVRSAGSGVGARSPDITPNTAR